MANFFDQFDAPTAPPVAPQQAGNFFDQFDAPPAAQNNPPAPKAPPSTAADMAASFAGNGVPRGLIETIMLPVTAKRLMEAGVEKAFFAGDDLVRRIIGAAPADQKLRDRVSTELNTTGINGLVYGAQDSVRKGMDDTFYAPKTTAGKYAKTVGEFVGPGAIPTKAARAAPTVAAKAGEYLADLTRTAVVPGVLSEAAGQMTEGTAAEPWARFAGAATGVGLGAAGKSAVAPEMVLRRAVGDPNKIDWNRAIALQNNSTGVRLTGPEAVTQAQGGASALPNVQRVAEGSLEGRAITAPFFAQRPGQVATAVGNVLDQIAPQSPTPSVLGPRAAQSAEQAFAVAPEGQALTDAVMGVGPRTTAVQAGEVVQPELRRLYDRREGMRNALADTDYEAARRSQPTIPVRDLEPQNTVTKPGYTRLDPGENPITGQPEMQSSYTPPKIETPSLTSRTGPDYIQADARPVVRLIDRLAPDARLGTADALRDVRAMLHRDGGVDTSVRGLDSVRGQINDMVATAKQNGQMQQVEMLSRVREELDAALNAVPAYRSATDNFRAASAPLDEFASPGISKAIERNATNTAFSTPAEDVASLVLRPSEAKAFNNVATTEAKVALENRLATQIMDAANSGGSISREALLTAMRKNEDTLAQFPELRARLDAVVASQERAAAARTGPLADVAAAKDTTAAGNAILPRDPHVGSQGETADAVRRLNAADAENTSALVRQNLADRFSKANTATQEGNREFAGAKFNKDVAGSPQQKATLDAVLAEVANGAAKDPMNALLDVLQATGHRKPIGSATEFNRGLNTDLGTASPLGRVIGAAKSAGASYLTQAGDAATRLAVRRGISQLAEMFTDPRSVELIREAAARGAPSVLPEAAAQSGALGGIISGEYPKQKGQR